MTRLTPFIARHPVATYFALTFAISWGGALLAIPRIRCGVMWCSRAVT